jgi:CheY-like chemotaxis protein
MALSMADEPTLSSLAGVRALVVEDHEASRDILRQALIHEGALVSTAASAREALAQIGASTRRSARCSADSPPADDLLARSDPRRG